MENITEEKAYELLNKHKGEFFTVTVKKKDGSVRTMNCRTGVKKHLKGGVLKYDPKRVMNVIVYDNIARGYRTVRCSSIIRLCLSGRTYQVLRVNKKAE